MANSFRHSRGFHFKIRQKISECIVYICSYQEGLARADQGSFVREGPTPLHFDLCLLLLPLWESGIVLCFAVRYFMSMLVLQSSCWGRELVALLNLSSWCSVMVERFFLAVPWGCLRFVIVVFPDHTHLLFLFLFFVFRGREDSNITKCGPSLARQRNAIKMAFRWRACDGPTLNAGLVFQRT